MVKVGIQSQLVNLRRWKVTFTILEVILEVLTLVHVHCVPSEDFGCGLFCASMHGAFSLGLGRSCVLAAAWALQQHAARVLLLGFRITDDDRRMNLHEAPQSIACRGNTSRCF